VCEIRNGKVPGGDWSTTGREVCSGHLSRFERCSSAARNPLEILRKAFLAAQKSLGWELATLENKRRSGVTPNFLPSPFNPLDQRSMGRTRTKSKIQRHVQTKTSAVQTSSTSYTTPSVSVLISKTQSIIEQRDHDLANQFIQRKLRISPNNVECREMLGAAQLETGLVQGARKVGPNLLFFLLL